MYIRSGTVRRQADPGRPCSRRSSCGTKHHNHHTEPAVQQHRWQSHSYAVFTSQQALPQCNRLTVIIIIIIIKSLINSAALKKLRRAAGICHSVLWNRFAFRCRAKVAVDSDKRRRSVGRLFQMSGPKAAKFLRQMVVAAGPRRRYVLY